MFQENLKDREVEPYTLHDLVAQKFVDRLKELTKDAEFFGADAVIATGQRTGDTATYEELEIIKNSTSLPVFVGSGVNKDNVAEILSIADGVIISSSLKRKEFGGMKLTPQDLMIL